MTTEQHEITVTQTHECLVCGFPTTNLYTCDACQVEGERQHDIEREGILVDWSEAEV